ncbi:MAG: MerR family transcriptional regulator [Deltaproteobacteria bacterium]|nr:MAG: MerR family transcriptional regulator [Deltaproteobacteria bacterium]
MSGVPAPTIKHYIRENLLPGPARRTSRNMAYYDAALADRIKAIKQLQQTYFLPLRRIADLLEPAPSHRIRSDKLAEIVPGVRAGHDAARADRARPRTAPARRTRADVLASMNLTAEDLDRLAALGLAEPVEPAHGEPVYADADLDLLEVIHEARAQGLGDLFPLDILEPYADCVRTLVRMEIELFRQRVIDGAAPTGRPLPEVAREATRLAERLIVAMRSKLVFPELAAAGGLPDSAPATNSAVTEPPHGAPATSSPDDDG